MAIEPLSAPDGAWNTQFAIYQNLNQQLDQALAHERDALERTRAEAQDDLLDTPAPTFVAVTQKLEILFEGELHGLDRESEARRLLLEDLSSLIDAQHQLLGAA